MTSIIRLGLAACALCALGFVGPSRAAACSRPAPDPSFELGVPADGAIDVPTDVVLLYRIPIAVYANEGTPPGSFTLRTAEGETIDIEVRRADSQFFEVVPSALLAPSTEHVLEGSWTWNGRTFTDAIAFTTGQEPLGSAPEPPVARLLNFEWSGGDGSSCGPGSSLSGSCIYGERNELVVLSWAFEDGTEADSFIAWGGTVLELDRDGAGLAYPCAAVRARGLNGMLSEPSLVCASEHPVHTIRASTIECTPSGLVWPAGDTLVQRTLPATDDTAARGDTEHDDLPPSSSAGCSTAARPGGSSLVGPLTLGAGAAMLWRRRRRHAASSAHSR